MGRAMLWGWVRVGRVSAPAFDRSLHRSRQRPDRRQVKYQESGAIPDICTPFFTRFRAPPCAGSGRRRPGSRASAQDPLIRHAPCDGLVRRTGAYPKQYRRVFKGMARIPEVTPPNPSRAAQSFARVGLTGPEPRDIAPAGRPACGAGRARSMAESERCGRFGPAAAAAAKGRAMRLAFARRFGFSRAGVRPGPLPGPPARWFRPRRR